MFSSTRYTRIAPNLFSVQGAEEFLYSDGSIEDYIAKVVSQTSDCSAISTELYPHLRGWPLTYHLSHQRSFLLRPLHQFLQGKEILELGAGCGALTRYLGETAKSVVALEGSPKRAGIAASRCRDLPNVTLVNDTIQQLEITQKFDVVTLIGVLEYARNFGPDAAKPEAEILAIAKSFLKPGGKLLLAIENQLGLKYFAGAPEDHMQRSYFGLHDLYGDNTPVTFGRKELTTLLRDAGFETIEQLIPLLDYKLPISVLFPRCFEDADSPFNVIPLIQDSYRADMQKSSPYSFSLEAATSTLVRNGLMPELCNSFFFIAGPAGNSPVLDPAVYAVHYGRKRLPAYTKETVFLQSDDAVLVRRRPLAPLESPMSGNLSNTPVDEVYSPHPLYHSALVRRINTPGWSVESIAEWAAPWAAALQANATKMGRLPAGFLDAIPMNCTIDPAGTITFFDQEWSFPDSAPISVQYIVFRGLCQSLRRVENVALPAEGTPIQLVELVTAVMGRLELSVSPRALEHFMQLEKQLVYDATGSNLDPERFLQITLQVRPIG